MIGHPPRRTAFSIIATLGLVASTVANSSPFSPADVRDSFAPAGAVVASGTQIPADHLRMYQANAIERKTSAGSERYTLVIGRGNLRTAAIAPSGIFEIPDGYRQIQMDAIVGPAPLAAEARYQE